MIQILCIRKKEPASYLQYVYALDCWNQNEGNCIISASCLCSRLCISERGKSYHINNMLILQIMCIRKRETVSYLLYVYAIYFVYQKEGNCVIPTICLCSRLCVSERGNCIIPTVCLCTRSCVLERGNCIILTTCLYYVLFIISLLRT